MAGEAEREGGDVTAPKRPTFAAEVPDALRRELIVMYVDGHDPPFRVPCAIQGDLFKFATAETREEAEEMIAKAVASGVDLYGALRDVREWAKRGDVGRR
jgi:hypothetical protein